MVIYIYIHTHTHTDTHIHSGLLFCHKRKKKILSYGLMGMNLGDIKLSKIIMLSHMILLI